MLKILAVIFLCIAAFLFLIENKSYEEVALNFSHNSNHLSGSLMLPKNGDKPSYVVVFVHGDGAMPYDAYGYYRPLWQALAEKGIASFSWNKAGVNTSTGKWQNQSMDDRADEVIAAIEMLKYHKDIIFNKIGVIGYSQAGWVLPLVAKKSNYPDFMVIVSGAINWMEQSEYSTKIRLTKEGFSTEQIEEALIGDMHISTILPGMNSYEDYLWLYDESYSTALKKVSTPMAAERFQFVKLNWHYDARRNLNDIDCPTLAVFGEDDKNIDIANSIEVYQETFSKPDKASFDIKIYSSTQHGILKSHYFDELSPGFWTVIKLEVLGNKAFANGYLEFVTDWIVEKSRSQ